jgi:hypothetical protein
VDKGTKDTNHFMATSRRVLKTLQSLYYYHIATTLNSEGLTRIDRSFNVQWGSTLFTSECADCLEKNQLYVSYRSGAMSMRETLRFPTSYAYLEDLKGQSIKSTSGTRLAATDQVDLQRFAQPRSERWEAMNHVGPIGPNAWLAAVNCRAAELQSCRSFGSPCFARF